MAVRASTQLGTRKQPKQARSTGLVAAILEAAAQVLAKHGAARFTTARVAERAGVSVGSLYQYFPNKAAILFRLQTDEWRETSEMFARVLGNKKRPELDRLRTLVLRFVESECKEATMRVALNDSAPLYRRAAEATQARSSSTKALALFLADVLPNAPDAERKLAFDLILSTLTAAGKQFSAEPRTSREVERYGKGMADMFSAYLAAVDPTGPAGSQWRRGQAEARERARAQSRQTTS